MARQPRRFHEQHDKLGPCRVGNTALGLRLHHLYILCPSATRLRVSAIIYIKVNSIMLAMVNGHVRHFEIILIYI